MSRRERHAQWRAGLLGPDEPEVSCEECFAVLDAYVELERASGDAEASYPGVRAHLKGCRACREEHDVLLAFVDET